MWMLSLQSQRAPSSLCGMNLAFDHELMYFGLMGDGDHPIGRYDSDYYQYMLIDCTLLGDFSLVLVQYLCTDKTMPNVSSAATHR